MKVNIQKFSEGLHEISENKIQEELDLSTEIKTSGKINLNAVVDKFADSFRIKLTIKTNTVEHCDKCLEEFNSYFEKTGEQIYKLGKSEYEDDDIEILPDNTREIELNNLINEIFLLNRSIQILCKDDCRGLCPVCGINLNHSKCNCTNERIDPRLEKLKSLIK